MLGCSERIVGKTEGLSVSHTLSLMNVNFKQNLLGTKQFAIFSGTIFTHLSFITQSILCSVQLFFVLLKIANAHGCRRKGGVGGMEATVCSLHPPQVLYAIRCTVHICLGGR